MKDNSLQFFPWHRFFNEDLKHFNKKFQMFGKGFALTLLEQIAYSKNGFWIKFDKLEQTSFCDDYNIREEKFEAMFNMLLEINFFDKHMFEKYKILTNEQIQKAFLQTKTKSRLVKLEHKEYMLPCFASKLQEITLSEDNSCGNVENLPENEFKNSYTKLNENVVENSKELSTTTLVTEINNSNISYASASDSIKDEGSLENKGITSIIDCQNVLMKMSLEDKMKFNELQTRLASDYLYICLDDSKNPFKNVPEFKLTMPYRLATYKVLFALIDLFKSKNKFFTIKLYKEQVHLTKSDIISLVYGLDSKDMFTMVDTVAKRDDIYKLPFFILGMLVRLHNQKLEVLNQKETFKEVNGYDQDMVKIKMAKMDYHGADLILELKRQNVRLDYIQKVMKGEM